MVPEYNKQLDIIEYDYQKVFDIEPIVKMLDDINLASLQIDLKFADIYEFIPNSFCKRTIRYHQRNIFKAAGHLRDYMVALNNSSPKMSATGEKSKSWEDPEVNRHLRLIKRECR